MRDFIFGFFYAVALIVVFDLIEMIWGFVAIEHMGFSIILALVIYAIMSVIDHVFILRKKGKV